MDWKVCQLVNSMLCCSLLLVLRAVCSCPLSQRLHVHFQPWGNTIVSTTCISVCFFLLCPLWWGDVAFHCEQVLNMLWIHLDSAVFFVSAERKSSFGFSRIILCVHSLCWRAWCLCFHSVGWLTSAPVPSWVTTASDTTCQQPQSYPNTPYCQKTLILPLPLIGLQSRAPSLHSKPLPAPLQPITDSLTPIYPPLYVACPMSFSPGAHLSVRLLFFCLVWFR